MIKIKKILVPTDLGEQSLAGIKYALSLARDHDADLLVLHVVNENRIPKSGLAISEEAGLFPREWVALGDGSQHYLDIMLREKKLDLYGFLHGHFELQDLRGVRINRHVRLGDVAEEIVSLAREERCDLIVMASRGRGWLARMISGSMSEEVARKAPCPILTIQPSAVVQEDGRRIAASSLVLKDIASRA